MTMDIEEKYDFFTNKVLSMPFILKDLLFNMVIEHRNLFMFFLVEYLDIYRDVKSEWGRYDPESVRFEMDPHGNIDIRFNMEKHKFHIHYSNEDNYNSELILKIDEEVKLLARELSDDRPMVTIRRH